MEKKTAMIWWCQKKSSENFYPCRY